MLRDIVIKQDDIKKPGWERGGRGTDGGAGKVGGEWDERCSSHLAFEMRISHQVAATAAMGIPPSPSPQLVLSTGRCCIVLFSFKQKKAKAKA
jgi:hypothetical protein